MRVYHDLLAALRHYRFWLLFGMHDAGAQFHRTSIGGLFHSVNMLLRIVLIYYVFKDGFGHHDPHYFGYISLGLPIFVLYSSAVTQGYAILRKNKAILQNMVVPYFSLVFRFMVENGIKFLFSIIPFTAYTLYNPDIFDGFGLYVILGVLIFVALILSMSLFSMIVSAFFPNIYEVINAGMGLMLFATPVFWHAGDRTGVRGLLALYNPLSHMIDIVREPALGRVPDDLAILVSLSVLVILSVVGCCLFHISKPWLIYRL